MQHRPAWYDERAERTCFHEWLVLRLPRLSCPSDAAFLLGRSKLSHGHQARAAAESSASVFRDVVGLINEVGVGGDFHEWLPPIYLVG